MRPFTVFFYYQPQQIILQHRWTVDLAGVWGLSQPLRVPMLAVLAGVGRAAAEVGAILIVGGNIAGITRTMTTAIALETSRGDLALALALGIILLALVLAINAGAYLAGRAARSLTA